MQIENMQVARPSPERKRNYWGDKLSEKGKEVVERLRRQHIPSYTMYAQDGYQAVDDIPETRRGILLELNNSQMRMTLEAAARSRILKIEAEDNRRGKQRSYERFFGAVRPRRGVKWAAIASEDDIRWHPQGITIVAKEARNTFRMAAVDVAAISGEWGGVEYASLFH